MQQGPWICDVCGKPVNQEDGYVEWLKKVNEEQDREPGWGMKIVHNNNSPLTTLIGCHYNEQEVYKIHNAITKNLSINRLQGNDGLMTLLQFIGENEVQKDEVVEVIKRLFIDKYEQARPYIDSAAYQGVIDNMPYGYYSQDQLDTAIKYGITGHD